MEWTLEEDLPSWNSLELVVLRNDKSLESNEEAEENETEVRRIEYSWNSLEGLRQAVMLVESVHLHPTEYVDALRVQAMCLSGDVTLEEATIVLQLMDAFAAFPCQSVKHLKICMFFFGSDVPTQPRMVSPWVSAYGENATLGQALHSFPSLESLYFVNLDDSDDNTPPVLVLRACPKLKSLKMVSHGEFLVDEVDALSQPVEVPNLELLHLDVGRELNNPAIETLLSSLQAPSCIKELYIKPLVLSNDGLTTPQLDIVLDAIRSNAIKTLEKLKIPMFGYDLVRLADALQHNNHLNLVDVKTPYPGYGITVDNLDQATWEAWAEEKTQQEIEALWLNRISQQAKQTLQAFTNMLEMHNTALKIFRCDYDEKEIFERWQEAISMYDPFSTLSSRCEKRRRKPLGDAIFLKLWNSYWPKIELCLKLNAYGRGHLLRTPGTHEEWWQTIIGNLQDLDVVYYFLSKNPGLVAAKYLSQEM